jgi:hypothetical protein
MPFGGLLTVGAISAGGSLFSGLFGASASEKAAQEYEAGLQKAENSLQSDEKAGLQDYRPYLDAGKGATTTLSSLLGTPGSGLLTPWSGTFQAPTAAQAEATPGYQFQLQQGENAMQNSAAGRGGLLSGRTLADLNNFAQGTASSNYQNVFNNAFTQYQTAYNQFRNNQQDQYSRLMGLSGEGLNATQGAEQFRANMGGDIASLMGQKGAAQAQGTIGAANAYGSILPGMANSIGSTLSLSSLLGGGGGGGSLSGLDPSTWLSVPNTFNPTPGTLPS